MIKSRYLIITILYLCPFIISGCDRNIEYTQQELTEMSKKILENHPYVSREGCGIGCGLFDINGNVEKNLVFNIDDNNFKKIITFFHMIDSVEDYKIILFDNFKQRDFRINGKIVSSYNYKANKNKIILLPIEIDTLEKGFHDAFFVIVKDPLNKIKDLSDKPPYTEEYFERVVANDLMFIRFNILVDSNESPIINFDKFDRPTKSMVGGIFLNKEKDKMDFWLSENVDVSEKMNFNIHVSNHSIQRQKFAVLTLLEWKQVDFYNNKNVVFGNLNEEEKLFIPSKIEIPEKKDVYCLVSILVYNPFETLKSDGTELISIDSSIRVGINAK